MTGDSLLTVFGWQASIIKTAKLTATTAEIIFGYVINSLFTDILDARYAQH